MWQLDIKRNDKGEVIETNHRTYTNATTGSRCTTTKVYTDREGNDWYSFDDLMTIPYTRSFAATKISSLYALGLTTTDAEEFFNKHKATLKAKDSGEKYEIAYAETLEFESKFKSATDPVKQMSSLVCVYFLIGDEMIDSFVNDIQMRKISILQSDPAMHGFFLTYQINLIESYTNRLGILSAIASPQPNGLKDHSG